MLFILGLALGAALLGLVFWSQRKGIIVKWYEWFLGALGFTLLYWAVHDFFGSMAEFNEAAGRLFLWMLGTPAIIFLGLAVFLPFWRYYKKAKRDMANKIIV